MQTNQGISDALDVVSSAVSIGTGLTGSVVVTMYVLGLLIVYDHYRARYGISEYQAFQAKYLAVGATYLIYYSVVITLAVLIAAYFADWLTSWPPLALFIPSLLPTAVMWGLAQQHNKSQWKPLYSISLWMLGAIITTSLPLILVFRIPLDGGLNLFALSVYAVFSLLASFTAVLVYYAQYIYGSQVEVLGYLNPIGTVVPVHVRLSGEPLLIAALEKMGVPAREKELTDVVRLIEETGGYYVVEVDHKDGPRAVRIAKDKVNCVLYVKP